MRIIEQSHEIIALPENALEIIEQVARTCYKSEDKIKPGSADKIVRSLVERGHHAMIEFADVTVKFITNRGVSHELVRHRHCSFAQESTRYVRYEGNMEFILPVWWKKWNDDQMEIWERTIEDSEWAYESLLHEGASPQEAREVLPNSLKTEINVKANLREWRHIFELRCSKAAHPQIRALMLPLLKEMSEKIPVVFDDLSEKFLKDGK